MEVIERLHPLTIFLYFLCVLFVGMFSMHPVMQAISFVGATVLLLLLQKDRKRSMAWLWQIPVFAVICCINPLVYHNGVTVLFYINGARITLEALLYGVCMAVMLFAVFGWSRALTYLMTSDRIQYLIGNISPGAALIFSMVLKFVPGYRRQAEKIRRSRELTGLYGSGSLPEKIGGEMKVFSALVNWSFEHSVTTAESMQNKYYGVGRRTFFHNEKFRKADACLVAAELILFGICIAIMAKGDMNVMWYPSMHFAFGEPAQTGCAAAYLLLTLLLPGYCLYRRIRKAIKGGQR